MEENENEIRKNKRGHHAKPFTEAEWLDRLKRLIPKGNAGGQYGMQDTPALFIEFVRSTQAQYKSVRQFAEAKGLSYSYFGARGGAALWNQARAAIQAQAVARAIDKSVDIVEDRMEKQLKIAEKGLRAMDFAFGRILKAQEKEAADPNAPPAMFETGTAKQIAETLKILVETSQMILNKGVQKHEIKSVNLHAAYIEAVKQRDQELGVKE